LSPRNRPKQALVLHFLLVNFLRYRQFHTPMVCYPSSPWRAVRQTAPGLFFTPLLDHLFPDTSVDQAL
jgi:hypothetical protein